MRIAAVIAVVLAGCASQPTMIYKRIDGRPAKESAALTRQFEVDRAICRGEMAKADSASVAPVSRRLQADDDVMVGCMAQRGYAYVPQ